MDILLEAAKYYKENLENAKFVIQAGKNDNLITFPGFTTVFKFILLKKCDFCGFRACIYFIHRYIV